MAYKLLIVDDRPERESQYKQVLNYPEFDPTYVWNPREFEILFNKTPFDGYLIDIFLDQNGWNSTAADLLKEKIEKAPRQAPVFLISQLWGEERVLGILKQAGESSAKVVQYLAWTEFIQAVADLTNQPDPSLAEVRINALRKKLLFELDRWHNRSGFRPEPDEDIRILVMADLQFKDPSTSIDATFAEHWIAKALKEDERLPDLIIIAGDLSFSGRPDEFDIAEERLSVDLMGQLWGQNNIERFRDRIVLVPGNHDVNLRFSASDNYKFDFDLKQLKEENNPPNKLDSKCHQHYALEPFRRFAYRLTGDKNWISSSNLTWVDRRFLHCGLRFFILNSVNELNFKTPSLARIGIDDVRAINRSIELKDSNSAFSIALSHHGLLPSGAPSTEIQVDNWEEVARDLFAFHSIPLWLYGHYHKFALAKIESEPFDIKPLQLVQVPTLRIGSSKRGFCLLDLKREDGIVKKAFIFHYPLEPSSVQPGKKFQIFGERD